MEQAAFARAAAQAKVGIRARTRVAAGVHREALGTVIRVGRVHEGHDVEVAWVWPGRRTPWVDWWTKAASEAQLKQLPLRGGAS